MSRKKSARRRRPGRRPPALYRIKNRRPQAKHFNALVMWPGQHFLEPRHGRGPKAEFSTPSPARIFLMSVLMGSTLGELLLGSAGVVIGFCVGLTAVARILYERLIRRLEPIVSAD